jgi:hypothetical protein
MEKPVLQLDNDIKLILSFDAQTGQVNVTGPINDRLFCFGLLELAKEAINAHYVQQQKQIMVARPLPMNFGKSS